MINVSFGAAKAIPPSDRKMESRRINSFIPAMISPFFPARIQKGFHASKLKGHPILEGQSSAD
jgi:hypothetical protein